MKENWILAGVGIAVGIGVLVAVGVLWGYWFYLGPISRLTTDWGSFGSVMSGAFTLLSSFATIGTLLFLYLQQVKSEQRLIAQDAENLVKQQKHDDVVEKQLAALTFDQYLNHRKVFIERLQEQSVCFKGDIGFADPDRVYTAMFPNNSPSNCEYKVEIAKLENAKPHDLRDCLATYASISVLLGNYQDKDKHLELVERMLHLQGCLGMTYIGPTRNGDIYFFDFNSGMNIYDFSKSLSRIERVLNSILFYTGNENTTKIHHKGESSLLRDAIHHTLTEYRRAKGAWNIRYEIDALPYLHRIYHGSETQIKPGERILEETFTRLSILFADPKEVEKLVDFDYANTLTDMILHEIKEAQKQYKDDQTALALLSKIDDYHWKAMELLGVTE